jgi:hypothetical protein
MNRKETEQAIRAELSRYSNISYTFEPGSKHPRVVVRCGDKSRKLHYSSTPIERRAVLNTVTDLRRVVREVLA